MVWQKTIVFLSVWVCLAVFVAACTSARSQHDPMTLAASPNPAYSVAMQQTDIVVAVSPVRQTMQIGGTIPTLLGAGISAVQDGQYINEVRQALGDYDACSIFEMRLVEGLEAQFGDRLARVTPLGTTAGFNSAREARRVRVEHLRRGGYDTLLDFELSFGIYGAQGVLALKIDGELTDMGTGRVQWRNSIAWYSEDLFADVRWRDPMQRMTPNIMAPRLTVTGNAIEQWTPDGAAPLKHSFEEAVDHVVAAVLTDLGLDETAEGLYTLGAQLLRKRQYAEAARQFNRALELAPNYTAAGNGLAVALAHDKQMDAALELAENIAAAKPDYMPVHYNLAWWFSVEMNDVERARAYYERAVALGAVPSRRLKRAMGDR